MDVAAIKEQLLGSRFAADNVPPSDGFGLYAFFIESGELPGLLLEPSSVLYIGMTESSLAVRNRFTHDNSGFSSPRRTLGALLKSQLDLRPIPRGKGSSPTNTRNYRFPESDERRLTAWMKAHLCYAHAEVAKDIRAIERALIADLRPPLNLTGWANPYRTMLRDLRRVCRQDAKANA